MKVYLKGVDLKTFIVRRLRKNNLFNKVFPLGTGGSPEYSFSVWLKHYSKLKEHGIVDIPQVVAELGPGSSLGAGIAAILSGSSSYYALDVQNYFSKEDLLKYFDAILDIFKSRKNGLEFPRNIFPDEILEDALNPIRVASIRKDIEENGANGQYIKYFAPWDDDKLVKYESVDFIFSQCVLEHVDKLQDCYFSMYKWMKKGSHSSHLIDFQCHAFTEAWNGHWGFTEKQWQFIKGSNAWAINRFPASKHIEYIEKANFKLLELTRREPRNKKSIKRNSLTKEFEYVNDEDMNTAFIDILIRK